MQTEVLVPELGLEAGQPILLSVWFAEEGDAVYEGDRLVELLVAGATFDVPCPADGTLTEILAFPDDELQPGQVLGVVETGEQAQVTSED
jgi:pyruvate/2-oxoglutarate dehydrogenase complex dihydrolipoamide acyltransferase (E2) component